MIDPTWKKLDEPIRVEDCDDLVSLGLTPPFAVCLDGPFCVVIGDFVMTGIGAHDGGCGCCASRVVHKYRGRLITHVMKIELPIPADASTHVGPEHTI